MSIKFADKSTGQSAMISDLVSKARIAQKTLANSSHQERCGALNGTAAQIRARVDDILAANNQDVQRAVENDVTPAFIDRLTLTPDRIESMAAGLEAIAELPDALGVTLAQWTRPNGLHISRVSTALGIIGVIYESRPNVTIDAGGLCLVSGNAAILRGGSDSQHSAALLAQIMAEGLVMAGLDANCVQIVPTTDRAAVGAMLAATGEIDVIIPRGGRSLVERVQNEARVPVFAHLEGICHLYVSQHADPAKAVEIVVNAKMRRTGICGSAETLLIDRKVADELLPVIADALDRAGCEMRGDKAACELFAKMIPATDEDWVTEYLDSIISVRIVDGLDEAMEHIARFGSNHTDCIITENADEAETFLAQVDSAIVMVNASTQFADGGEFGMGAEIGIATGRIHARGPVGAAQLTCFKYAVRGNGQIRPQ